MAVASLRWARPEGRSPIQGERTFRGTNREAEKALAAFVAEVAKRSCACWGVVNGTHGLSPTS
jgi:hypothetical protein